MLSDAAALTAASLKTPGAGPASSHHYGQDVAEGLMLCREREQCWLMNGSVMSFHIMFMISGARLSFSGESVAKFSPPPICNKSDHLTTHTAGTDFLHWW